MSKTESFEHRVAAFEAAWRTGTPPPDIADYLSSGAQVTMEIQQLLMRELICIDLEMRWRHSQDKSVTVKPLAIEHYLQRFHPADADESLWQELIAEEYRARHRWGDRPTATSYFQKFPQLREVLASRLCDIDRELQIERGEPRHAESPSVSVRNEDLAIAIGGRAPLDYADFVLEKLIGAGRTGKVYRARQISTGRNVAIKYLRKEFMRQSAVVQRFIVEAATISHFDHSEIVSLVGLGKTARSYFIAMELVDGPDLAKVIRRGSIPIATALHWTRQACGALAHAHNRGIIHCDLKPGNLFLDAHERIHVTDFGIAHNLATEPSASTSLQGTAPFMAPEQVSGYWGPIGPRTDVYGLGAVLFTLLTGQPPWTGSRVADVLAQVVSVMPARAVNQLRPDVSEQLAELCASCLAKAPAERPSSMQALDDALGIAET